MKNYEILNSALCFILHFVDHGPTTQTEILSIYTEIESGGDTNEKIWRDPDGYQLETRSSVLSPVLYSIESYSSYRKSGEEHTFCTNIRFFKTIYIQLCD